MKERLIGAFKGDIATYEEVEHDENATMEAAIVVAIAAVLGGIGAGATNSIVGGDDSRGFFTVFILGVISALIGWLLFAAITHFVGSRWFGAQSTIGEMLRVTGYASVVLWASVIPIVGGLAGFWYLWVVFKAIRAGLDISTGKTVIVIVIGLIIRIIIGVITTL